jgi:hypothetical protein
MQLTNLKWNNSLLYKLYTGINEIEWNNTTVIAKINMEVQKQEKQENKLYEFVRYSLWNIV